MMASTNVTSEVTLVKDIRKNPKKIINNAWPHEPHMPCDLGKKIDFVLDCMITIALQFELYQHKWSDNFIIMIL